MTPELHSACLQAGPDLVKVASEYLRGVHADDGSDLPVRNALADCLDRWSADLPASGVDSDLLAAVDPAGVALSRVGCRLRVNDAIEDETPIGRLMVAAWRELDAALFAQLLSAS